MNLDDTHAAHAVDQLAKTVAHLPVNVIAEAVGVTVQAWRECLQHRRHLSVSQFMVAARLAGVRPSTLFDDDELHPLYVDAGRIVTDYDALSSVREVL